MKYKIPVRKLKHLPPPIERRQDRWDAAHLVSWGCKLTVEESDLLDQLCSEQRVTRYGLIRLLLLTWASYQKGE